VVVLPELFSTGFVSSVEKLHEMAETDDGKTILSLKRWAQYFNVAICGSFLMHIGSDYYNRGFFVEPSGDVQYYNKRHLRKGTLWQERFKSVIVEDKKESLTIFSVYTDLNSVRAGITKDPRFYQWSGIAKACSGNQAALKGIAYIMKTENKSQAFQEYCALTARKGLIKKDGKFSLSVDSYKNMIAYSKIDYGDLSDYSIGAITRGYFIGSTDFVDKMYLKYKMYFGVKRKTGARKLPCNISGIQLYSLRQLRKEAIVSVKKSC
jgi:hypothetical protein